MTTYRWERMLVTGVAGRLGSTLRDGLRDLARIIRVTDIRSPGPAREREEVVIGDLSDVRAVQEMMVAVDVVLHFGAVMVQASWDRVLPANIVGSYNVFEAARAAGVKRVILASSSHAVGMYPQSQVLDGDTPARPDTPYGLGKAFAEDLARMYFDKYGIEAAILRIGSCFEKPTDERMLATWLSHRDMVQLCRRCLEAPTLGCTTVYGVSANQRRWWDNRKAAFLGYAPVDNAEIYAEEIFRNSKAPQAHEPAVALQGGRYVDTVEHAGTSTGPVAAKST